MYIYTEWVRFLAIKAHMYVCYYGISYPNGVVTSDIKNAKVGQTLF